MVDAGESSTTENGEPSRPVLTRKLLSLIDNDDSELGQNVFVSFALIP
jgi:hypothetical protein